MLYQLMLSFYLYFYRYFIISLLQFTAIHLKFVLKYYVIISNYHYKNNLQITATNS